MKAKEFDKRVEALGITSRALRAARAVLVHGESRTSQAAATGVDLAQLSKLCKRIETASFCSMCGRPMPKEGDE